MSSSQTSAAFLNDALQVRSIEPKDAIDVWRLCRHQVGIASPFFFMIIARHCASIGVVAERDGDVVGFALGSPDAHRGTGRIVALSVAAHENSTEVSAALLEGLLGRAAFAGVVALETTSRTMPVAADILAALGTTLHANHPGLRAVRPYRTSFAGRLAH
jgi:hypothetical protein